MIIDVELIEHGGRMMMLSKVIGVASDMAGEMKTLNDFAQWAISQADIEQIKSLELMEKATNG